MKKTLILLLCLCLICLAGTAGAASVDVNGAFRITCKVPDGYKMNSSWVDSHLFTGSLDPDDPEQPVLLLTVAWSELSNGRTLNEYSEEEIKALAETYSEDLPGAEISYDTTGLGTKLIVFKVDSGSDPHLEIFTIYKGYELSLYAYVEDGGTGKPLTADHLELIRSFLTDMTIE